jgi:DNA polymerase III subunit delta'
MRFSEVTGQEPVKEKLRQLYSQNRLSHALLFSSREGSGALPLALAFAQYIMCSAGSPEVNRGPSLFGDNREEHPASNIQFRADACGVCPSCLKAQQLIHPDIHYSYPTVTRKAGEKPVATDFISEWREFIRQDPYGNLFDWIEFIKEKDGSQGKITADECNDIIRKFSLKSFEDGYKILIMWMPEMLDKEGNKLLKIIEEPPANTLFILVTENEDLVLPTIQSRCQLIRIPPLSTKDIEQALIEKNHTAPETAGRIASICEGNYREALQMVQHSEEDWQALLREWLNAMLKNGPIAQIKWVEDISRLGREKQKQFLRYFIHLLETALHIRLSSGRENFPDTEKDFAVRLNKIAGLEEQYAMLRELNQAIYFIERNANAKILFQALTLKLYHIIQNKIVFLAE